MPQSKALETVLHIDHHHTQPCLLLSHEEDDLAPSATPGYKPTAVKTVDEYAKLDAEDESLARWKASLGIVPGALDGNTSGPKVTVLTLELASSSLPPGKQLKMNLQDPTALESIKKNPVTIKEGVEYNVRITFKVNHSIISGVRYIQVVKRAGVKVDKMEQMLGSYGPHPKGEAYTKNFDPEESPSGMLARSGSYHVRSRVVDDDGEVFAVHCRHNFHGVGSNTQAGYRVLRPCLPRSFIRQTGSQVSPPTPPKTWVDRVPSSIRPYLYLTRIDKPIGTLLLFYPCTWSITMASYALQLPYTVPLTYISLFGLGALIMRGAGCTINDMWDRNLDKGVDRTKERPLARGDITPTQAFMFLGLQLTAGLGVLTQLNWYSILLGASSLSVVAIYPFMKRVTYWPQAFLGLAFNWGALLGWSAVAGSVDWSVCLPLYAGGFCWTLVYDSIYAHQDKTDDINVGIRSTALLFGKNTRPILSALSVSSISLITYAGLLNGQGTPFYLGVGLAAAQLARVLVRTDFDDRASCWKGFQGCGWAGFLIWMGALADYTLLPWRSFLKLHSPVIIVAASNNNARENVAAKECHHTIQRKRSTRTLVLH
ncbi:4-hydroxybenzoate polyprenyltransferase, mitochondrial [Grifola frondosa]|uniref:4-hydroxybenzoate polyprenyltransferase, mitochondrial n=1 Tax=Grifola frondosa TaxID=5627 RepID=A0A1C7MIK3_GRIFR|nr:4-hydroxybenzoate polyprenyltransferase, mitochondrial [Grifola frondosa]